MKYLITKQNNLQFNDSNNDIYSVVSKEEALEYLNKQTIVGVDTETFGFDPYTRDLFTVQIGNKERQYCIDISTISLDFFKDFFEDKNRLFIFHNAKFDLRFFLHKRFVIPNIYDTFLAEKVIWLGTPPGVHRMGLNDLCEHYLGIEMDKSIRVNIANQGITPQVVHYACEDVKYLLDIREKQLEIAKKNNQTIAIGIENSYVRALAYIEYSGFRLDKDKWSLKMKEDQESLQKAEKVLNEWVLKKGDKKYITKDLQGDLFTGFSPERCNINWNSSKQVAELFTDLGLDIRVKDNDTGLFKDSIEAPILKRQIKKSTIIEPYLEYSSLFKTVSTYGQTFIDQINPKSGRLHTQFNQIMDTTRLSSGGRDLDTGVKNINFQNIPADERTRSCFVAKEGNKLICSDYSGQEDLVFTELSQEPKLIEFHNDKVNKRDGHSFVAKMCFPDELKDVPEIEVKDIRPDLRQNAKGCKFCYHYGGEPPTAAAQLNIPLKLAQEVYTNYFNAFPGIKNYFTKVKREAWNKGYILISKYTGHKSYIYNWEYFKGAELRFNSDFWKYHRENKKDYDRIGEWKGFPRVARNNIILQFFKDFGKGETVNNILDKEYIYRRKEKDKETVYRKRVSLPCLLVEIVSYYFSQKGAVERSALNFPVQGTSAQITKIATIKYYEHLVEKDLLFLVWIANTVHDEIIVDVPEYLAEKEAIMLKKCMEDAGKMFCKSVTLRAEPQISNFWKS